MADWKASVKRFWRDIYRLRYGLLGIAAYFLVVHLLFGQFCPSMILFHFPCPGCGMTRSLGLVLTGHWAEAWELQPLVYGWIVLGVAFGYCRYVRNRKYAGLTWLLVFLLLGTLGIYGFRLCMGFPSELL